MANKLASTVESVLSKHTGKKYTAQELAQLIIDSEPEYLSSRRDFNKKTKKELKDQIVREIYSDNSTNIFSENIIATSDTPKLFYFENSAETETAGETEEVSEKEKELYPKLCDYLFNILRVYPKRIDEKKSSKIHGKNANKWLHPDIVGLQVKSEFWTQEVKECCSAYGTPQTILWSFEVKQKITLSNVREYFFQTVSNSSWANNSYLVATEIEDKALSELQILCKCHNIGVIQLNKKEPYNSQILIPTIEYNKVDWDIINRISSVNTDFKSYIETISEFYKLHKIKEKEWDINN